MRVALVSLNQVWLNKDRNLDQCNDFAQIAKDHSCELAIFPEMTLTGYSLAAEAISECRHNSPSLKAFSEISKSKKIHLIYGAVLSSGELSNSNTLCMATPSGKSDIVCEKIHPFSFANEDRFYAKGSRLGSARVSSLRFGAAICYDLRFPEIFSVTAKEVDAFIVIACWPKRRVDHWFALLKARAIENQCYMIGVNCTGIDGNNNEYEKSSAVFTPEGMRMTPEVSSGFVDIFNIERNEVERYRNEFPTIKDKRYALYRHLYADR